MTDCGDLDREFMRQAIETARKGWFIAPPNPAVGCVIVRDGRVISTGYTHAPGSCHAEIDAIENAIAAGESVKGATVYVTLEPCSHYGRTPPCARRLVAEKVARVVIGCSDPNPLVCGKGVEILREAGIEVLVGVCESDAYDSNIGFMTRMRTGLPWVRVKTACSLDGRTALPNGQSKWITQAAAREDGRLYRARSQAILTGIGTVLADDPEMSVRIPGIVSAPRKFIADAKARTPVQAKILQGAPVTIFVGSDADPLRCQALREAGAEIVEVASDRNGCLDIAAMLGFIGQCDVNVLHVEAGATLTGALISGGFADEIVMYLAPCLMGQGRAVAQLPLFESMQDVPRWKFSQVVCVGEDIKCVLRRKTEVG